MERNSGSDYEKDEEKSQRGPTMMKKKPLPKGSKVKVTYNDKGVPVGKESTSLATFEGLAARTMIPITYANWWEVNEETKNGLWQYVQVNLKSNLYRYEVCCCCCGECPNQYKFNKTDLGIHMHICTDNHV